MNNKYDKSTSGIGIYFAGINAKERATFDRVIAFNVTHGLVSYTCNNSADADLIIASEEHFSALDKSAESVTLVIANQAECNDGDYQVTRPLLITRVMNKLGDAIKAVKEKSPVIAEAVKQEEEIKEAEAKSEENNHSGHHALVIDDSASIRKQLELELRDAGITADFADSGEQALERVETGTYDLIFLDIMMPGIDGYETCKRMRAMPEYKKTPIIMLSGKTSPLDEVQGVIAGATTYLTKPVKSAMLQETLTRVSKWINNFAESAKKKAVAVA